VPGFALPRRSTAPMNAKALERFREACGLSAPLVLECEGPSQSAAASVTHSFNYPFVLVGRHPRADLFLDDSQISRRHAFLHAIAGRILVIDLQSRTKVFWEGDEAPRSQGWIEPEEFIRVGPYRIRRSGCQTTGDPARELPAPTPPSDHERSEAGPVPRAALEFPIRVRDGAWLWPVEGHLAMVGRSDHCQLVLTDDSISRFHAALVPTPSGLWVVDLLARDGVHVNGERIRWAWLADGDTIRMGQFTFILRYESPPDQVTRQDVPLEAGASPAEQQPGTELAVSARHPHSGRRALVVRPGGRSSVALQAVGSPPTSEPAALVPSGGEAWEPPYPYPPNPMAMWQQQMQLMESFHNDMILMVQMFVAMHKEHSASVRHELDMVQQLTRELSALQARTAQNPEAENAGLTSGVDRPSRERGRVQATDRQKQDKKRLSDQPGQGGNRTKPKSTEPAGRSRAAGSKIPSAPGSVPPVSDGPRTEGNEQIHALLTQRIAQLQRERQGYWQRILSTINR